MGVGEPAVVPLAAARQESLRLLEQAGIEERRTGATSISRMKPNSRSHTIEAAENIAVNITVTHRIPG